MTTKSNDRISSSALKVLTVLKALKGHTFVGLSNSDLAKGLEETPTTINRCLNTLIEAGLAVKLDNGRFALSVGMLQIAVAHANEMGRAADRIQELTQRINTCKL